MKKKLKPIAFIITAVSVFLSCTNESKTTVTETISQDSLVKRGNYLVTIMGCEDCHSPKKMGPAGPTPDPAYRLGGHLADSPLPPISTTGGKDGWVLMSMDQTTTIGPWGISYAANISSDSTGIGAWSEQQFAMAMRNGKFKGLEGNRTLLPPMPWPNYTHLSDTDLMAIFTYLKSSKAVKNIVPMAKSPGEVNK